jgi:hypothetical protein
MPEPSNDSVAVTPGVTTGMEKAEAARKNMELRGPIAVELDQLNDNVLAASIPRHRWN